MITTFEQLWYVLAIALLSILIGVVKWSVNKIINYIETTREEQKEYQKQASKEDKEYQEKMQIIYQRLEQAVRGLENSISLIQQGCTLKHIPITNDIEELKKKTQKHTEILNNHEISIKKLENHK